ncbi:MAG: queuosine precursor transporter [Paracoccaceae bacterium]
MRIFYGIIAMATVVVASNILVQFLILDGLLTWGAFTYPIAFLVTDVMNRVYGANAARKVIFAGFIAGIICSLIGTQITIEFAPGITGAAVALRVAIGSAIAFLIAQLTDVVVFNRLRSGTWWRAPLASSIIGSALDTAIFFTIAFSASMPFFSAAANEEIMWAQDSAPLLLTGPDAPLWVTLALADWGVKLVLALLVLVPFRVIVKRLTAQVV